jgi:hypothetical protein
MDHNKISGRERGEIDVNKKREWLRSETWLVSVLTVEQRKAWALFLCEMFLAVARSFAFTVLRSNLSFVQILNSVCTTTTFVLSYCRLLI